MRPASIIVLATVGLLAVAHGLTQWTANTETAGTSDAHLPAPQSTGVLTGTAYAIDGDTIRIEDSGKVRLQGVAAPERNEPGGPAATDFMKRLVNGKEVRCELDGTRTYDRQVGICFVDGRDIGEAVIAAGLARDCPRYSGGRYAGAETPEAIRLPFPGYC
ncbi:MAG: thermonuclease family protein [Reyranella sp.]|nr:thermonuclease family protein [Reyranella sp.]